MMVENGEVRSAMQEQIEREGCFCGRRIEWNLRRFT